MVGRRMSPGPRDMRPVPPGSGMYAPPPYHDRERMKREFRKPGSPEMRRHSRSMSPPPMKKRHPPPSPGYRSGSPPMRRRRSFTPPQPPMRHSRSHSRSPPRKQRAHSPRRSRMNSPPHGGSRMNSPPRGGVHMNSPPHGGLRMHSPHRGGTRMNTSPHGASRISPSRTSRISPPRAPLRADPQRGGRPGSPLRGTRHMAEESRESHRSVDGNPNDFYGPWGTRIAMHDLRKITVDIKRNLPKGKRSTSPIIRRIIKADDIVLYRKTGEGSLPLFERADVQVNLRFDDAQTNTANHNEPRVVAIIREPNQGNSERRDGGSYDQRSHSRDHGFMPTMEQPPSAPVGDRIDRDRSERAQRQVEKLEQMEVAIDRKLHQIQRYERKYEETMQDEKYGDGKDDRKTHVDRNVRDRLGHKRAREFEDEGHGERLPDFSQRPNKPPIWNEERVSPVRAPFYGNDNGFRGRGRGGFRARGRGGPRGRGRFSPTAWQHDKYEGF